MDKLKSRKFWICIAAFLASIAASISGITSSNEIVAAVGIISGIVSAAIYAACEAAVDVARLSANETVTTITNESYVSHEISASSTQDKELVKDVLTAANNSPVMEDE